jgi:hypothetical protein
MTLISADKSNVVSQNLSPPPKKRLMMNWYMSYLRNPIFLTRFQMVDAPARVIAPVNSDDEAAAEILPSSHRPPSVSSGMSICSEGGAVPDTDPEDLRDDEFASKAVSSCFSHLRSNLSQRQTFLNISFAGRVLGE